MSAPSGDLPDPRTVPTPEGIGQSDMLTAAVRLPRLFRFPDHSAVITKDLTR